MAPAGVPAGRQLAPALRRTSCPAVTGGLSLSHADLISKQLMADGLIRVKVEISELEVYDM